MAQENQKDLAMTREQKDLVRKDLCCRLPYGVYVQIVDRVGFTHHIVELNPEVIQKMWSYKSIKPYLRPMSSMSEEEAKELLFVRLQAKYGTSCAYIKNFIKLNEVSFREKSPYEGSIAVWFSFENKIHDTPQIREYSKCEYLGQINDITLAEIDWLNKNKFDFRGVIPKDLALSTDEFNPYED